MIGPTFCDCNLTLFFWQQTGITEKFRDLDLLDFKNNPLQTSELDSASGKFSIEVYNQGLTEGQPLFWWRDPGIRVVEVIVYRGHVQKNFDRPL